MKGALPRVPSPSPPSDGFIRINRRRFWIVTIALLTLAVQLLVLAYISWNRDSVPEHVFVKRNTILSQCKYINTSAGPPPNFSSRTESDRFVSGTKPVLLQNAKIWTGARNGTEIVYGDILLDKGLIKAVGYIPPRLLQKSEEAGLQIVNANGAWVTPGLVDLHSHIAVGSAPSLNGAKDTNSLKAPILPWLRSIDGLNTHDASYELAVAGGVTTAQILPGSANNIGGQSFVIKLRPTDERSPTSKVVEPPYTLNGSHFDHSSTPRWRHMKHACGENPSRVYSQTRMDSAWNFRNAYNEAQKLKDAQDNYCARAEAGLWEELDHIQFPEDLKWEALVDVLRGKVKLSVHCYEAVDLDAIVRLSNEFKFPVASFHHAGETYLVPDLLKKTWGGAPSIALFASNARKKREAYRGSEFAPRILASHGIPVVMKSDHPVVNSRYLLNEAAQVHYYGLNPALALAAVTSTPANAAGLGHRLGTIQEGFDADVVVWDSHPLALGATPRQVFIDGNPQFLSPHTSEKPQSFQSLPETPNFDREAAATVEYEGLPPLAARKSKHAAFINIGSIFIREIDGEIKMLVDAKDLPQSDWWTVVVREGSALCADKGTHCLSFVEDETDVVDLQGGSLTPGLTTFGSPLGLVEIRLEPSTNDGSVYDILTSNVPSLVGGEVIRAVDGLQFGGRNSLLAYRGGVTKAITAPTGYGFLQGLSTAFALSADHALEKNAIIQEETALHITIGRWFSPSVSTKIAALRKLLFADMSDDSAAWERVRQGIIPLVVHVENADIMSTLIILKAEYEETTGRKLRLTFVGAAEAHLLAKYIAQADISVVLTPSRSFPGIWDQRRILPGPPLTQESSLTILLDHGVNVAIGVVDEYAARNTRFDLGWAALESSGKIGKVQAIALATTNLDKALGLESSVLGDIVAYAGGGMFDFASKAVAVISAQREVIDLF